MLALGDSLEASASHWDWGLDAIAADSQHSHVSSAVVIAVDSQHSRYGKWAVIDRTGTTCGHRSHSHHAVIDRTRTVVSFSRRGLCEEGRGF